MSDILFHDDAPKTLRLSLGMPNATVHLIANGIPLGDVTTTADGILVLPPECANSVVTIMQPSPAT
jgi:hypothetical protein